MPPRKKAAAKKPAVSIYNFRSRKFDKAFLLNLFQIQFNSDYISLSVHSIFSSFVVFVPQSFSIIRPNACRRLLAVVLCELEGFSYVVCTLSTLA